MIIRSSCYTLLLPFVFSFILFFSSPTSATTPTSFCKCTCFGNSTIIDLDRSGESSSADKFRRSLEPAQPAYGPFGARAEEDEDESGGDRQKYRARTCSDCNRQFCLDYNLPICKGAGEKDVFTICFQRDSQKDQAVVFIFIIATAGLLSWALIKPWVEKWLERARERRSYIPVSTAEEQTPEAHQ